ncbi:MAG TPA: Ig-like domain-containing protein [Terriglobales bacterium]|nr:Ig-like domain-containing protein [Terriglobales bacterium]
MKFPAPFGLLAVASLLLTLPACGHDQQLVSITIVPAIETFGDVNTPVDLDQGLNVQLRALGSYIHPPVTKDITNQVTWASNTPQMVTVNSTGLITATGLSCGGTIISATVTTNHSEGNISSTGALVTGSMTANVVCFVPK